MDLDKAIRDCEKHFRDLYLAAIPLLHKPTGMGKTGHYLSFSTVLSGIECLGSIFSGKGPTKERFKEFVGQHFKHSPDFAKHVDQLWDLRNSLVHTFCCGDFFGLTHASPKAHFKPDAKSGRIILNAESFLDDLSKAADSYFAELGSGAKGVRDRFKKLIGTTGIVNANAQFSIPQRSGMVLISSCEITGTNSPQFGRSG